VGSLTSFILSWGHGSSGRAGGPEFKPQYLNKQTQKKLYLEALSQPFKNSGKVIYQILFIMIFIYPFQEFNNENDLPPPH
jgi:hypothetical protein